MDVVNQVITDEYSIYQGDSTDVIKGLPDESVHYTIFSPPFAELYAFSNSERDIGNAKDYNEFFSHFEFLIPELHRITKPGRLLSFHCMDLPSMKERDGIIGLKDFPGDMIRAFIKHGWIYHSRHIIWKDPLIEVTRTKALGLMHKQLKKDSAMVRAGLPDYLITMRKQGENSERIEHPNGLTDWIGLSELKPKQKGDEFSRFAWKAYASPIWMDIRQSFTLQRMDAKGEQDEKHISLLQLDVISRALELWTNKGDIVFSPFMGIGSEGYMSIQKHRKFCGIELKER